jgi:hypothetical protein
MFRPGPEERMTIKVFISHKKEDAEQAAAVAAHLTADGLSVYLDVIDGQLGKSGPDLADYIRAQLDNCTQLLAVISSQTQASWWVPWEIGVATEKERFLASFVSGNATVPEYLAKWPLCEHAQISTNMSRNRNEPSYSSKTVCKKVIEPPPGRPAFDLFTRP